MRVCRNISIYKVSVISIVVVMLFLFIPEFSYSQTFHIVETTENAGTGSLRQVIADAEDGDTIAFDLEFPAVIELETQIQIDKSLTIVGPGAALLALDGMNNSRIFLIENGNGEISVNISGITFRNGSADNGGAIQNRERLTIEECIFHDNSAVSDGGAINNTDVIESITGSTFFNNSANFFGGAIQNRSTIENISNSTFHNNSADFGGAIRDGVATTTNLSYVTITNNTAVNGGAKRTFGTVNIINSIVAFNEASIGNNCSIGGGGINNRGGNFSNDDSCNFGIGNHAFIPLGPLADNGGPTLTVALLGGDPLDGATEDCDTLDSDGDPTGDALETDQRGFPRPIGNACDSGAYEAGGSLVRITKLYNSPDMELAAFNNEGFEDFDCALNDEDFILSHNQTAECGVTEGFYSITEEIPANQIVNIICTDIPQDSFIDSFSGTVAFNITVPDTVVKCFFINSFANIVINIEEEPAGENCSQGGVQIETGFDSNQNGVLDPEEVDEVFFVCDGESGGGGGFGVPGPSGPPGEPGPGMLVETEDEPPGDNCEFGGVRITTGFDTTGDGNIDDVTSESFVCQPGVDGTGGFMFAGSEGNSNCSLAGEDVEVATGIVNLFLLSLMTAIVFMRRRIRKI